MPQLLTPDDIKIKEYIQKKALHADSIKRIQKILNKTNLSLTRLVIEERERRRW